MVVRTSFIVLVTLVALLPSSAIAWFDMGHMTVAAYAYQRLDSQVKAKVATLLKLNPEYENWTRNTSPQNEELIAFTRAATWADDIKKRHDYQFGTLAQDGSHAFDNIGYVDHAMHNYWHYIDFPFSPDGTPLKQPDEPNGLTQIRTFASTLTSNASDDVKSYDLVWLLHLVGDAHQPLHATSRFSHQLPKGDNGGNAEILCRATVCGLKLHAYWDGLIGDSGRPEDAVVIASSLLPPNSAQAAIADPQKWFEEGAALAQSIVYTAAIGDGTGPFTLDDSYQTTASQVARDRVALAGARLANLLNAALKK
jgi:S1/P1 Nuclease